MDNSSAWRHGSLVARLAEAVRNWRSGARHRQQPQDAVASYADAEPDAVAGRSALRAWPGKWPDSADLLSRRMASLQIDPVAVRAAFPELMQQAERSCSLCLDKAGCHHDLDSGVERPDWAERCPNSGLLMALSERPGVKR